MAELGINVDRIGTYDPRELREAGVRWLRLVAMQDVDLRGYLDRCHAVGLKVLMVIARESLGDLDQRDAARLYADRYSGLIDALQVGNESDHESPSSWTLPQARLNSLLRVFRGAFPSTYLVGPGLVSGNADYLNTVDLGPVDAISVHPYGQGLPGFPSPYGFPGHLGELLGHYRRFGKPIWITEWGIMTDELGDEVSEAYMRRMVAFLREATDIVTATVFCWSDAMVRGFGLLRADGSRKSVFEAFRSETHRAGLARLPDDTRREPGRESEPRFEAGFARWAALEPRLIGQPLENEWSPAAGVSQQLTTTGLLTWVNPHAGPVLTFYSFANRSRFVWREGEPASREVPPPALPLPEPVGAGRNR